MKKIYSFLTVYFIFFTGLTSLYPQVSKEKTRTTHVLQDVSVLEKGTKGQSYFTKNERLLYTLNQGQWDDEVIAMASGQGYRVWVSKEGLVYDFESFNSTDSLRKGHVVKMKFDQGTLVSLIGKKEATGKVNYYIGSDPDNWVEQAPQFEEIIIGDVYDGISLRLYGEKGLPRYDLIIEPNADLAKLSFSVDGVEDLKLDREGNLSFLTSLGEIKQSELFTYQEIKGQKKEIASAFKINHLGEVKFELGAYDPELPLVIDPIIYSTFIGPSGGLNPLTSSEMEVEDGFVYLMGEAVWEEYPTTSGAYQTNFPAESSIVAYFTKLNREGTDVEFSTFFGGEGLEAFTDMAVENGNIYFTGAATQGFPTTVNAYQKKYTSGGGLFDFDDAIIGSPEEEILNDLINEALPFSLTDAFVTKLSANGGSLIYSTFLGGTGNEIGTGITVEDGYAYVTGGTGPIKESEISFPTTALAYQRQNGFGFLEDGFENSFLNIGFRQIADVFVTKLSVNGSRIEYSTLLGSDGNDLGSNIEVENGKVLVTATVNENFPATSNAIQATLQGADELALFRLNTNGSDLEYGTIIGRAGVSIDTYLEDDNFYLLGTTVSASSFPITPGAFLDSDVSFRVPFLMKFSDLGDNLEFSTFVGSLDNGVTEEFIGLGVENNIPYLTGVTNNPAFFTTPNAYVTEYPVDALDNAFVMQLFPNGQEVNYSTFIGGYFSRGNAVRVEEGLVYLDGFAGYFGELAPEWESIPITENAYFDGSGFEGEGLRFMAKFDFELDQFELDAPALVSPANNATLTPIRPEFTWADAINPLANTEADFYVLQVSRDPEFSTIEFGVDVEDGVAFNFNFDFDYGIQYFWRVRGVNDQGQGTWSEVFSFITLPSNTGEGTLESPWEISTVGQLNAVRNYLSGNFKLVNTINMRSATREGGDFWNDGRGWIPIGTTSDPFTGQLQGDGFELISPFLNGSVEENAGIVGVLAGGFIERVALIDPDIAAARNVGGLVGLMEGGEVRESYVSGGSVAGNFSVGGLVGAMSSETAVLENSYSFLEVNSFTNPVNSGGGVVGRYESGTIQQTYSFSNVNGGILNVGPLIGSGTPDDYQSYFNEELTTPANGKGIPLSSAEMRIEDSFQNWDFEHVWKIEEGKSFPVLIQNEQIPAPGQPDIAVGEGTILYVDPSAGSGLGNGSSWGNAILTLQEALEWAEANWQNQEEILQIYVAEGVYFPTTSNDASISFELVNQVEIYGGFPTGGSSFDQRDWKENQTILSGDILNRGSTLILDPFVVSIGNSIHVVNGSNRDNSAKLDGFYINAGFAVGSGDLNDGGGIFISAGSPVLTNLMVIANRSNRFGAGMATMEGSTPTLSKVEFRSNFTSSGGGGVANNGSSPRFTEVLFLENASSTNGGGMYNLNSSSPILINVEFRGNEARGGVGSGTVGGGAMWNAAGTPVLTNVLLTGNRATLNNGRGGAILNNGGSPILTNVTLSGNSAFTGGGIYNTGVNSVPQIRNSIIWNNQDDTGLGTPSASVRNLNFAAPEIVFSLIQGVNPEGQNNLDGTDTSNDPQFIDPIIDFESLPTVEGDFRLAEDSPLKGSGNLEFFGSGQTPDLREIETDLDGSQRIIGEIDLGAYELFEEIPLEITPSNGNILYVKKGSSGLGIGDSWQNAIPELADALKWARENQDDPSWSAENPLQIWVAGGTYIPLYNKSDAGFRNDGERLNSFVLVPNVQLFGGFAGVETNLEERDLSIKENTSILNGDREGNDGADFANYDDNVYQVLVAIGELGKSLVDGFTVRGGNASSSQRSNFVTDNGSVSVLNNVGGGFYINPGFDASSFSIKNVKITENSASVDGGGIHIRIGIGDLQITNATVADNTAGRNGGGIENSSGGLGGQLQLNNVTLADNTAIGNGGGIYNGQRERLRLSITNSLLLGNSAESGGNGVSTFDGLNNEFLVSHSLVQGMNNESNGNISAEGIGPEDVFEDFENGDYRLKAGALPINAGDPDTDLSFFSVGSDEPVDLDGNPRVVGELIDMGAFERQQVPQEITFNTPPSLTYGDRNVKFDITTTSGQEVSYSVAENEFVSVDDGSSGENAVLNALKATDELIEITVSVAGNDIYDPTSTTVSIPVGKRQLEIADPTLTPKEFDGTTTAFLDLGTQQNLVDGDEVQVDHTATYDTPEAGTGKIVTVLYKISGADSENYLSPVDFVSNDGEITPAEVEGIEFEDESFVFDGTEKSLAIT
ncbi:YDG domain-containing protein, partial [Algoriphagus sp.]|uniref:DUF7948 domain-containing protein n=1 Tax=Algoriphagus sp. TaxID=1872435 RepID=UPI00263496A6